ncbi:MAG: DUF5658 family protein [Thermoplasmatota archaeon]
MRNDIFPQLLILVPFFILTNWLDALTTHKGIEELGIGFEQNPIVAGVYLDFGFIGIIGLKIMIVIFTILFIWYMLKFSKVLLILCLLIAGGLALFVGLWNLSIIGN